MGTTTRADPFHILEIRDKLTSIKTKGFDSFKILTDENDLGPRLEEETLKGYEMRHAIRLPEDYREFLIQIGNGGLGPSYEFFALDINTPLSHEECWWDYSPSGVFPLAAPLFLDKSPRDSHAHSSYLSTLQGVIPIFGLGCGMHIWLVVNGAEWGHLWQDDFASEFGIYPLPVNYDAIELAEISSNERQTFTEY